MSSEKINLSDGSRWSVDADFSHNVELTWHGNVEGPVELTEEELAKLVKEARRIGWDV